MQQVRKTFILKNQAAAADDLGWMGSGAVRRAHVHTRRYSRGEREDNQTLD